MGFLIAVFVGLDVRKWAVRQWLAGRMNRSCTCKILAAFTVSQRLTAAARLSVRPATAVTLSSCGTIRCGVRS